MGNIYSRLREQTISPEVYIFLLISYYNVIQCFMKQTLYIKK